LPGDSFSFQGALLIKFNILKVSKGKSSLRPQKRKLRSKVSLFSSSSGFIHPWKQIGAE
jgi:hypothetical protein